MKTFILNSIQLELTINNFALMFFNDYSQFLEPQSEIVAFRSSPSKRSFQESQQYFRPEVMEAQHDLVYSEFTEIVSKRLVMQPYPANFKNHNPFCPLCLKIVRNAEDFTTCYISNDRNYLIHRKCFDKDKAYQISNIGEILNNSAVIEDIPTQEKKGYDLAFDTRLFYLEICFSHPIHDKAFFKINKKTSVTRNEFHIQFNQTVEDSYFPNVVLLPLTDFQINVNVVQFGKSANRTKYAKYVSLKNIKDRKIFKVQCQDLSFTAEIIQGKTEKQKLMDLMNYKYRFGSDSDIPLLRILGFKVKLPEEFQESEDQGYIVGTNSTIVEELLKEKDPVSTIKSSSQSPAKYRVLSSDSRNSSIDSPHENEKINLSKLIRSNSLIDFVKNNTQSRLFQNYLQDCNENELQVVIEYIKPYAIELVMHEYGNYMIQKLFKVCNPNQRLGIIEAIQPNFCDLIKNKQGTHTIQAFVSEFTLQEEYTLVTLLIREEFYDLCRNNNSTHFIQKFIKTFPLEYTLAFFNYTVQNLLAFALDKNAMCVIKHMMRRFRQLDGTYQAYEPTVQAIRRQLITHVTFSVDRLIMDSFGNYVIQFCYELFDLEKCAGITERILSKFAFYATGKFSSNVIIKCISIYWTDKRIYSSLRNLSNNQIIDIFRNKDGNKILLEIMEKLDKTQLWDRLYSILIKVEPTRFYHDRWGVCLGSRSGQVGYLSTGFPEPKRHHYNKRK